jgi:hypothetical protein
MVKGEDFSQSSRQGVFQCGNNKLEFKNTAGDVIALFWVGCDP